MADKFQSYNPGLDSPASGFAVIAPADGTDLPIRPRALYVGGSGDIAVIDELGVTTVFKSVQAGTILPIRPIRVLATNTTATLMVGMW